MLRRPPGDDRAGVYEAAHAELDELLPGDGSLFERRQAWRDAPARATATRAVAVLDDLLPLLRERTEAARRRCPRASS